MATSTQRQEAEPATAEVLTELKRLRKGFGVDDPAALDRVGPALRRVAGITPDDGAVAQRVKLRDCLLELTVMLPPEMALVGRQALALDGCGAGRFGRRLRNIAADLDRDPRTARRRVDVVLERLAEEAVAFAACVRAPG